MTPGNFLVQLARRGAGIAPTVRPRVNSPAFQEGGSEAAEALGEGSAPAVMPLLPPLFHTPQSPQTPPIGTPALDFSPQRGSGASVPSSMPAAAVVGSEPMPLVRRLVAAPPALPAPGRADPGPLEVPSVPPAPSVGRSIVAANPPPPLRPSAQVQANPPIREATPGSPWPTGQAPSPIRQDLPTPKEKPIIRPVTERTVIQHHSREVSAVERRLEYFPNQLQVPRPAAEQISLVSPPQPAVEAPPAMAERVVEIHIGAIEIQGATPPPAMPPPSPAPGAAPTPLPGSQAGFEAFSRLRRYAPWER
jgi:hypothetical protein